MNKSAKVTVKQIALEAGVSIGTVDRALMGRAGISPATKALVLATAERLGYRPNKIASALSRKRPLRLGVVYAESPEGFYTYIDQGVSRAAQELADFGIVVEKLRTRLPHPGEQLALLNALNPRDYDGFIINADGAATGEKINQFARMGIPVCTFDSDAPGSERLFFVGCDARQSGRLGGEIMGKTTGAAASVAVIGNFAAATTFIERYGGFCEEIQNEYPGITLYPCAECHSEILKAQELIARLLQSNAEISGIFAAGYSATVGAAGALQKLDRREVRLVGYDLSPATVRLLREGWCTAILYEDPAEQGYRALRYMADYILENTLPPSREVHIGTKAVFRCNVETYPESREE